MVTEPSCLAHSRSPQVAQPSNVRERCSSRPHESVSPNHFLACDMTGNLRTRRHTAVKKALAIKFHEALGVEVMDGEPVVGMFVDAHGRTHDLKADIRYQAPEVKAIRAFRKLAYEAAVQHVMRDMHNQKIAHYRRGDVHDVKPLVMTAGGSVSEGTRDTFHKMVFCRAPTDATLRSAFRAQLYGRLSVLLIKFATMMLRDQTQFFISFREREIVVG